MKIFSGFNVLVIALIIAQFILITNDACAQKKPKKRSGKKEKDEKKELYKLISNDPMEYKNLHISLSPFFFDLSFVSAAAGADIDAYYAFNNIFAVHSRFQQAYYDNATENGLSNYYTGGISATKYSPFRNFEVGGTYFFDKKLKDYTEKVVVKSETSGRLTTNYYIPVPAQKFILHGVRLGFQYYRSNIISDNSDGIQFIAEPKEGGDTKILNGDEYSTLMQMNVLSIGVSRTSISDVVVDVTEFGEKTVRSKTETYLDLMFAPAISYADMIVSNPEFGEDAIVADVNKGTDRSRFGAKLGYNVYPANVIGFNYGLGIGVRPGPGESPLNLLFLSVRLAANISAKI